MPHPTVAVDPYVELDVPRNASQQEIKQAYRRIALATHPDHHANDATAAERFRRASQSYALLRNPERRLAFDRTGRWDEDRWEPAELDEQLVEALEIFARDFGAAVDVPVAEDRTPAHTGRVTMTVDVSYDEVERGGRRQIPAPCVLCAGSGAREGSAHVRCTSCGGSGRLRQVEASLLGPRIHTEQCESCHGSGRRPIIVCPGCEGSGRSPGAETMEVLIPRGTADGDRLTAITDSGLRFVARLAEDQRWARDGADLYTTKRIPYEVAVLGGPLNVELPGRTHRVEVSAATASGHRVRIAGQGLPLRDGGGRGDLILTLHVTVPERVGVVERWLLKARRRRSGVVAHSASGGRLFRAHAWARDIAVRRWTRWRTQHHQSSFLHIEKTAASLRSAAELLSDSEQRLGPLLEQGFPMIAPAAARARRRLDSDRFRHGVAGEFIIDSLLALGLGAGLWLLAWYAAPAIAAAGKDVWWEILRKIDPASFALVPLVAGIGAGALRAVTVRRGIQLSAVPLWIAVGAAVIATGAAVYATIMHIAPAGDFVVRAGMSGAAAFGAGVVPVSLFLLGNSIVDRVRMSAQDSSDVATARLATHLEGTERAFRQLLTQADDARHPLTSLLNGAADALTTDGHRRLRSIGLRAALALASSIVITMVWIAATALAMVTAFTLLPDAAVWSHLATAAATAGLCTLGILLPPARLEHPRTHVVMTALATVVAIATLVGILTVGPGTAWVAVGGATAALALSFRLPDSIRATSTAAVVLVFGAFALILWPIARGVPPNPQG